MWERIIYLTVNINKMKAIRDEVKTDNLVLSEEEAIKIAMNFGLEHEVAVLIKSGYDPIQALEDWDILPDKFLQASY